MNCESCIYWGIDERGYKRPALIRPVGDTSTKKLCLKVSKAGSSKYTKAEFSCNQFSKQLEA